MDSGFGNCAGRATRFLLGFGQILWKSRVGRVRLSRKPGNPETNRQRGRVRPRFGPQPNLELVAHPGDQALHILAFG
jgi:hypothetical protein